MTQGFRDHIDELLRDGNFGLAFAPKLAERLPPDSFELALGPRAKAFVLEQMRRTGADKGFGRTIGAMTNGQFSADEIKALENRVLDQASLPQAWSLRGIEEGPPVDLNARQKAVIDELMGKLGSDPLA